jgi:Protein of unknown function (DUF3999)
MKHRLVAVWAVPALLSAAAAFVSDLPAAWRAWRYSRAVQTGQVASPIFCEVHVAPAVFPHSQNALGDLRIIDEIGAEVPYNVSAESGGTKTEPRHTELRENSYAAGQYTQVLLDLGKQPAFHNAVKVDTPEQNFMNWVEVAASDDTRLWRIVKARAPISRFRQENLDGNQIIHYSQNNARYLRLRILEASRQFPVSGAEIFFNSETLEPVREPIPVNLVADSSAPTSVTRWSADFEGASYPISEVAFKTSQPEFFRAVRVQTSDDGRDWSFCGAGEIYRYKVGEKLEESLRVPLYNWRSPRYWRVEVLNQNDAPLQAVSARFVMHARKLYFEQKPGHSYRLIYGNARAQAARYDLERLVSVQAQSKSVLVHAELGAEELTSNYYDPRPFTERHSNVLWIALGVAVLLLAYAAMRSLKPAAAQSPSAGT